MATIDIGKIKPVFKGTYDNSTAYVLDDIVYYNGSSYVAKTSTTGNLPTDTTKWNILASGSGGIWDSTLSIGSAGQQLKVSSGGALEFFTASGGGILQAKFTTVTSEISVTPNGNPSTDFSNMTGLSALTVSITPASTSNKILVFTNFQQQHNNNGQGFAGIKNITDTRYSGIVGDFYHPQGSGVSGNINIWWLDTPTTTNATEYRVFVGQTMSTNLKINTDYYSNVNGKAIIGAFEISSSIL